MSAAASALARPQQRWHSGQEVDLATLAAAYAFGVVKNHPYRDGNTRIGFLALVTCLNVNGLAFDAPEQVSKYPGYQIMLCGGSPSARACCTLPPEGLVN